MTSVLHESGGPIILIMGGISDFRGFVPSICRFCGLKVKRPCPISTSSVLKLKSVLSRIIGCFPRKSRGRPRSREPGMTVVKGPGIKGSSLVGGLTRRSHMVMSSVTKAAESTVSASVGCGKGRCMFVSATKLHHGGGVGRRVRHCDVVHTIATIRHTSIIVVIVSTARKMARRSTGVTKVTRSEKGNVVVTIGG